MSDFLCTALLLLALGLTEAALGPRGVWLDSFLALLALLPVFLHLAAGSSWRSVRGVRLLVAAAAAAGLALAYALGGPARYFGLAAGLACLALVPRRPPCPAPAVPEAPAAALGAPNGLNAEPPSATPDLRPRPDQRGMLAAALALAALGYGAFAAVRDHLTLWPLLETASTSLTSWTAALLGTPARLGPTYSGTWLLAACFLALAARAVVAGRLHGRRAALALLLLVLAPAATLALRSLVPESISGSDPRLALGWRALLFVLLLLPVGFFLRGHPLGADRVTPRRPATRRRAAWASAALALAGLVLLTWSTRVPSQPVRVLLDTRGSFDLTLPRWGEYGPHAPQGATLSSLPGLLAARGFALTRHDTTLDAALLGRHDVLMVMNPTRPYTSAEHQAIWDFVRRGGGLLALGDHTNIMETMGPINALLVPCGMRVNFDCAIPLVDRWTWYGCMRLHPHPVTRGVRDETDIKISVGASLRLPPGALPLLTGRDAFSDAGNWQNRSGAYLGNMRPDRSEALGDVTLAAVCRYGRGKVMLFGDTSAFQRTSLLNSHEFVTRIFTYMARPGMAVAPAGVRAAGALLLAAGAVLVALALPAALPALALCSWLACAWLGALERVAVVQLPREPLRGAAACVDLAHGNRVDLHAGLPNGIGGLADHLIRQGFVPVGMKRFEARTLAGARLFVSIAPAFPFTASERRVLQEFVRGGGLLLVATGYEERRGAEALLADFGYAIGNTPIGAAHESRTHLEGQRVLMHESWPVLRPEGRGEVWAECWGYPLIVFERLGKGGLLVIGDSRFLCDVKLESKDTYVEPNIDFLRRAIETAQARLGVERP